MRYRNIKTGAEIETKSKISAPNWIPVGADAPIKENPPIVPEEIPVEAPKEVKEDPKTDVKKTASKKNVKRTKK